MMEYIFVNCENIIECNIKYNFQLPEDYSYKRIVFVKGHHTELDGSVVCALDYKNNLVCLDGFDNLFKQVNGEIYNVEKWREYQIDNVLSINV